ncbi:MAG: hypothetical protein ABI690_27415 [Chloroflexota bacterium]
MARKRIDLFLDLKKKDERLVLRTIENLKAKRYFSSVVRDGIMIVNELRQGKVDLLLKLYPWVADAIRPPAHPIPVSSDLEGQIADLKQIILQQGNIGVPPVGYPVMKQIGAPPVVTPKTAPAADAGAIADNFLAFIQ